MSAAAVAMAACSGERLVVFLFVSRILYSVPLALSYEAFGMCLLAVAGLLVEIVVEESPSCLDRFKIRRGASSGILLGTVTMPAVMLSRLIQLSRLLSNQFVGIEDFTYTKIQYWTVSMSCLGVVVSIYAILQRSSANHGSLSVLNIKNSKFSMIHLVFYCIICYMSLKEELLWSLLASMKILWFLLHGLATVGLIWYLICTFPSCASIGEFLLVSSGLILYFGDMLAHTFTRINPYLILSNLDRVHFEQRSEIGTIIQGILIGLLLLPTVYKLVLCFGTYFTNFANSGFQVTEGISEKNIRKSIAFYASLFVMLTMVAPSWMQFVHDFQVHPLLWVFNFVFEEAFKRLLLCVYWISIIFASVLRFYGISKHSKIERILLRKYYHLVAVAIFSPAVLLQPKFLDLAFGAAFAVFLVLEMIRVWKIWPFGKLVDQFMNAFTDHRDSDILIVSHFSLLLGCALPKWISSGFNDRPLAAFAGILSLGIGDTMASVVGYKYGVLRWSKAGKKTIEGTAAGITSVLVACAILLCLPTSTGYILSQHWSSLLLAVTVSGLLEAHTAQLDNAFIPLVFYSLLCL